MKSSFSRKLLWGIIAWVVGISFLSMLADEGGIQNSSDYDSGYEVYEEIETPEYVLPAAKPAPVYYPPSYTESTPSYSGDIDYYTNSQGNKVQSPTYYPSTPSGATAQCEDGTYSFSQSRSGTCSHHGGVQSWL